MKNGGVILISGKLSDLARHARFVEDDMKNRDVVLIRGKLSNRLRRARLIQLSEINQLHDLFLIQNTGHVVYRKSIHRRHEIVGL